MTFCAQNCCTRGRAASGVSALWTVVGKTACPVAFFHLLHSVPLLQAMTLIHQHRQSWLRYDGAVRPNQATKRVMLL